MLIEFVHRHIISIDEALTAGLTRIDRRLIEVRNQGNRIMDTLEQQIKRIEDFKTAFDSFNNALMPKVEETVETLRHLASQASPQLAERLKAAADGLEAGLQSAQAAATKLSDAESQHDDTPDEPEDNPPTT